MIKKGLWQKSSHSLSTKYFWWLESLLSFLYAGSMLLRPNGNSCTLMFKWCQVNNVELEDSNSFTLLLETSPGLYKWFCCNLYSWSKNVLFSLNFFSAAATTKEYWKQENQKKRWFLISPPAPRSRTLLLPPRSRCHTSGPRRALWPRACCTNTCRHLSPD